MPCFHPIKGWLAKECNPKSGKRAVVFKRDLGFVEFPITLPCGRCVGCRLERSRQWAMRCIHEASLHKDNCFITLTYDNDHLPSDGSVNVKHFQNFMKRLRKRCGDGIRFFHCGEYGEMLSRPHYHACLFNFDFPDRKLFSQREGVRLYTSEILSELWTDGFSTVGDVTFESAAYVARYVMKKVTGDQADHHYETVDLSNGLVTYKAPEYVTMSRRPGIAAGWLDKFTKDVYNFDHVEVNGLLCKPPRFYDNRYDTFGPKVGKGVWQKSLLADIKHARIRKGKIYACDSTPERLHVREHILRQRLSHLKRNIEMED